MSGCLSLMWLVQVLKHVLARSIQNICVAILNNILTWICSNTRRWNIDTSRFLVGISLAVHAQIYHFWILGNNLCGCKNIELWWDLAAGTWYGVDVTVEERTVMMLSTSFGGWSRHTRKSWKSLHTQFQYSLNFEV